jgi:predicted aldo/keto reductase-like oxidoreductase
MKRRDFLKLGIVGAASAAGLTGLTGISGADSGPVYRVLGRTGLKVTVVSFGAMLTPEHEVMAAAFDLGVNYVDTARRYMNGRNEEIVGRALKGRRDKVYLATKTQPGSVSKKDIFADVETSLSKLKTDYIDVIQLHNLTDGNKERIMEPETRAALLELRKQGKVRFFGVTTHTEQDKVLNTLLADKEKFFDTALVGYNFKSGPEVKEAIARAAKAGIGITAMKTQAGGYKTKEMGPLSPHQAALKWALMDNNVTNAIPGMKDMKMLQEDMSVMGMKFTARDARILERYAQAIEGFYCHLCAVCEPTCPQSVAISTVNRSLLYAEAYGSMELGRSTYGEIKTASSASVCQQCPVCVAQCAHGLDIGAKMRKARDFFA